MLLVWNANATGSNRSASTVKTGQEMTAVRFKRSVVHRWIDTTHHWQRLLGVAPTRASHLVDSTRSLGYLEWSLGHWKKLSRREHLHAKHYMIRRTTVIRTETERMIRAMGRTANRRLASSGNVEKAFNQARRQAGTVKYQFRHPPEMTAFMCIHSYEGSWTDQDSGHNGHYGGVQFGRKEWLKFGYPYTGKLWAYLADKYSQLWAAYRYYLVSGFSPWPATAHACGLI